ncbi:MAG: hypothetical protein LW688_06990 [Cryomorphaceae bacterium]|jgi:hypothetical protein|nr:hypothetical protein [Cryomorphaceae bacterium]
MKVYIRKNQAYSNIVTYVLKLIENNGAFTFIVADNPQNAQLIWDHQHEGSEFIAVEFYEELRNSQVFKIQFDPTKGIIDGAGNKDMIASIFYMVNCLQELNAPANDFDAIGRYKYEASFQNKHGVITQNLVQKEIDALYEKWHIIPKKQKSVFFLSHDIDTLYGSFLQDGFWAVKNFKPLVILKLLFMELMRRPHWRNLDRIVRLHDEHDVRSTFFWLVNKGRGESGIMNADYDLSKEKSLIELVQTSNNANGLHKSCSSMDIDAELEKSKLETGFNRYHFLNFRTHSDWKNIEDSKLSFDASLGFAEHFGFRNSYGKAFQPYNVEQDKPFSFVEAPLHFMDGTFHKYMHFPAENIAETIIEEYSQNPYNCDFSVLWHNTFFTDYKYGQYLTQYKRLLEFISEEKIDCLTPDEIIKKSSIQW